MSVFVINGEIRWPYVFMLKLTDLPTEKKKDSEFDTEDNQIKLKMPNSFYNFDFVIEKKEMK